MIMVVRCRLLSCNVYPILNIINQKVMKHYLTLNAVTLLILVVTILSCTKGEHYTSNGEIIGLDPRTCICCGGAEITIDNVQNPNGTSYFLIGKKPSNFNIGNNPKFPITVTLDYTIDTAHCFGSYINITRIARR